MKFLGYVYIRLGLHNDLIFFMTEILPKETKQVR